VEVKGVRWSGGGNREADRVSGSGIRQSLQGFAVPFHHPFRSVKVFCELRISLVLFLEFQPQGIVAMIA
jgi:hypothetical protein